MGVQGLSSFVENNSQILQDVRLRSRKLIVDGNNLTYLLYFESCLDQIHGGDYEGFEALIRQFVKNLRDCDIEPYVVLDGGFDPSDNKFETLKKRARQKIRKAHNAAMGLQGDTLPPLTISVLSQTLAKLRVSFARCYGEADRETASLARDWNCPVLSNDSDFYIFDIPAGFLPISHFNWKVVSQQRGHQSYISCKRYTTSSFCIYFDINPQLLPAFAAISGNDYVKLRDLGVSIDWAGFASMGGGPFEGLLRWLRDFKKPIDAFEGVLEYVDRHMRAQVLHYLQRGIEEYELPPSCLKLFFREGSVPPLQSQIMSLVPGWTLLPLTQGRLTPYVLDVLQFSRVNLRVQVDDAHLPSANRTSQPIRQVFYGLLLGIGKKVEEYDREGLELTNSMVQARVPSAYQLTLGSLHESNESVRLQVLLQTLGVQRSTLSAVPAELRLPVAVSCYWFHHATPTPDRSVLQALLLGMVSGELQRNNGRGLFKEHATFSQKLDLEVTHAFNQWQASMMDSIHLNQLLGFPLPDPHVADLYRGPLVHQLVPQLRGGFEAHEYFLEEEAPGQLYRTLLAAVYQSKPLDTASPSPARQKTAFRPKPTDKLVVDLERLALREEEAEERAEMNSRAIPEDPWGSMLVKTRYKTKGRGQSSQISELAYKQKGKTWDKYPSRW